MLEANMFNVTLVKSHIDLVDLVEKDVFQVIKNTAMNMAITMLEYN